jgi:predicted alpha-1,2-mannosidase
VSPGYYRVVLRSGVDVRLTATTRTGLARFAYPRTATATLLLDGGGSVNGVRAASLQAVGLTEIRGWITSGDFCAHNRFSYTLYFDAVFNRPIRRVTAWDDRTVHAHTPRATGPHAALVLGFDTRRDPVVLVKVGLSYVDEAGARRNLRAEEPGWDFDGVRRAATHAWNGLLGRIVVRGGSAAQRSTFYTALYHALIEPTVCGDVDGAYRGLDGQVHHAHGYTPLTNIAGWDTYRGKAQLLALLAPRVASDMARSLLAAAHEGGWLPKWLLGAHSLNEMVGDSADPLLAETYAFGARGFDASTALHDMVSGATRTGVGPDGYVERPGLDAYQALGYVPEARGGLAGPVSVTLEYALDDFAVAQLAGALGDTATVAAFLRRAQNWRMLYNPATGYLQPRWADGTWRPAFDPASTWLYTEGNAAQYTWFAPQDLRDLIAAMGGDTIVQQRLDAFFTHLNAGPAAPYAWMGNEPSILVPWVYTWAGAPWKTQAVVRRIMTQLYDPGPGGLDGNDDLGTMSAWYVWAALGLYPAVPGTGILVLHGPLFPWVHVSVPHVRSFTIEGQGAAADHPLRTIRHPQWARMDAHMATAQRVMPGDDAALYTRPGAPDGLGCGDGRRTSFLRRSPGLAVWGRVYDACR